MATITKSGNGNQQFGMAGAALYGNVTVMHFELETRSDGSAIGFDVLTAIADGDKLILGRLPEGARLDDSLVIVSDAFTASVVGKLGFEYTDGIDSSTVPQDDDYFGTGLVLNATGRLRNVTVNKPVRLPKEAYLILTSSGAAHASVGRADILVSMERFGPN